MNSRELSLRRILKDDFRVYARACLKIRAKSGAVVSLNLNRAQAFLHDQIEDQIRRTGKARKLILKGRQQGISTYIEGRGYWRVTHGKGLRAFILTHDQEATDNLFGMAMRYHENMNSLLRPQTGAASAKELSFDILDSGYKVGTAGTKGVGRSSTIQFFHGSEVAFWPFAETHAQGVMQAIPEEPGTEAYLESTANGTGNYFHEAWQQAEAGIGQYEPVFIPWFWQAEYRKDEPIHLDADEVEYMEMYGLDKAQMAWRRAKIQELKGEAAFRQEYPATPAEAFLSPVDQALISPSLVSKAMQESCESIGPKILGVDVARFGDDRTAVCFRQGRKVHWIKAWAKQDTMETSGRVKTLIDEVKPDAVFVDVIGIGAGVVDRLKEMGYSVEAAAASHTALNEDKYTNRRAEMYGLVKEWLEDRASLPEDSGLMSELCSVLYKFDSRGRLVLEKKEDAKKRGVMSPDKADSLALTFYSPVALKQFEALTPQYRVGGWMS